MLIEIFVLYNSIIENNLFKMMKMQKADKMNSIESLILGNRIPC